MTTLSTPAAIAASRTWRVPASAIGTRLGSWWFSPLSGEAVCRTTSAPSTASAQPAADPRSAVAKESFSVFTPSSASIFTTACPLASCRTVARTVWPWSSSRRMVHPARKPVPPVTTTTLMVRFS